MENILIIDDYDDDCGFLLDAIQQVRPGVNCTIVQDATEGVRWIETKKIPRPDMIFLDLNMPSVNCVDCLRLLKHSPNTNEIPVVIYSCSKSFDVRIETQKIGAFYYVIKPSSFRFLCHLIREIFAAELIPKNKQLESSRGVPLF